MRVTRSLLVAAAILAALPGLARAQAAITGTVKDTSGAVLPGVTVEAASPALIEKVRSAVTDGTGQYRIVDLRPGSYSLTFTLPGFSTVKRDGIELTGTFTAIDQCRDAGRSGRGDGDGVRRDAGRRRDQHEAADDPVQRTVDDRAHGAILGGVDGADSHDDDIGRQQPGHPGDAADDRVRRRRRP